MASGEPRRADAVAQGVRLAGALLAHPQVRPPLHDGEQALVRPRVVRLAALGPKNRAADGGADHVVGGGAQNALLCQLLADRLGLPVLAGPVEATALGNVLVQGRALGAVSGSLEDLRALIARTHPSTTYLPGAR